MAKISKSAVDRCYDPLDLSPAAQQAFRTRQMKLITDGAGGDSWPSTRWYNDEDFCRAYNTAAALQAEIVRLREQLAEVERRLASSRDEANDAHDNIAEACRWLRAGEEPIADVARARMEQLAEALHLAAIGRESAAMDRMDKQSIAARLKKESDDGE